MSYWKLRLDCNHVKASGLPPDGWPPLKAGEVVRFVRDFNTVRGRLVTVLANGLYYDIYPHAIGEQVTRFGGVRRGVPEVPRWRE